MRDVLGGIPRSLRTRIGDDVHIITPIEVSGEIDNGYGSNRIQSDEFRVLGDTALFEDLPSGCGEVGFIVLPSAGNSLPDPSGAFQNGVLDAILGFTEGD